MGRPGDGALSLLAEAVERSVIWSNLMLPSRVALTGHENYRSTHHTRPLLGMIVISPGFTVRS